MRGYPFSNLLSLHISTMLSNKPVGSIMEGPLILTPLSPLKEAKTEPSLCLKFSKISFMLSVKCDTETFFVIALACTATTLTSNAVNICFFITSPKSLKIKKFAMGIKITRKIKKENPLFFFLKTRYCAVAKYFFCLVNHSLRLICFHEFLNFLFMLIYCFCYNYIHIRR